MKCLIGAYYNIGCDKEATQEVFSHDEPDFQPIPVCEDHVDELIDSCTVYHNISTKDLTTGDVKVIYDKGEWIK